MGEYGRYKGNEIKLGTCETMYYIRFEHCKDVTHDGCNIAQNQNGLRFRLPYPDEDKIQVGHYEKHERNDLPLDVWKARKALTLEPNNNSVHGKYGQWWKVECYHGMEHDNARYNGLNHHLFLKFIKCVDGKLYPVIGCVECHAEWRIEWSDLLECIDLRQVKDGELLLKRLLEYSLYSK